MGFLDDHQYDMGFGGYRLAKDQLTKGLRSWSIVGASAECQPGAKKRTIFVTVTLADGKQVIIEEKAKAEAKGRKFANNVNLAAEHFGASTPAPVAEPVAATTTTSLGSTEPTSPPTSQAAPVSPSSEGSSKGKWIGFVVALVLVFFLISQCGGDDADEVADAPDQTSETTPTEPAEEEPAEEEPEPSGLDLDQIRADFRENLAGAPIKSMCDDAYTHWSCFFDDLEEMNDSTFRVHLTTDGGWSDSALDEMADRAGLHWFNFIGEKHEEVDTIVVRVNGIDHNVFRKDVPLLNR